MRQFKPAKAKGAIHYSEIDDIIKKNGGNAKDFVSERKMDGSRYLLHVEEGGNCFSSRRESVNGGFVDKTDNVPHLRDFDFGLPIGTVLDGEIVVEDYANSTSSVVTSIMGAKPDKALDRQNERGFLHYIVYDILFHGGQDLRGINFGGRRSILNGIFLGDKVRGCKYIHLIEQKRTNHVQHYLDIVNSGGEGIMFKNLNSLYDDGCGWKIKKHRTFDAVVMGYTDPEEEGKGGFVHKSTGAVSVDRKLFSDNNWKQVNKYFAMGWISAVIFGQYKDGALVEIGQTTGMDDETRKVISENREKYIGRVIEIEGQEQLKSGAIRHPSFKCFRDDKNAEDCLFMAE